jgi:pSer/pThr/pTyr-binding forkhead associated (FHA) protein
VLTVRRGPNPGHTYALAGRIVTVGRGSENDIPIEDRALSRRHLQISWVDTAYRVEDLGSRNGTKVNEAAVQTADLHSGDRIRAGNVELEFTLAD